MEFKSQYTMIKCYVCVRECLLNDMRAFLLNLTLTTDVQQHTN